MAEGPSADIALPLYQTSCAGCHGSNGEGGAVPVNVRDKSAQDIQDAIDAADSPMAGLDLTPAQLASLEQALVDGGAFAADVIGQTAALHFAMFRRDFFRTSRYCEDGSTTCTRNSTCEGIGGGVCQPEEHGFGPFGISTDCASIWNVETEGPIASFFAGMTSDYGTVADIDTSLRAGYEALPGAPAITGDTAFAYMVAAKISENVWQQLMGEPLTLVNRYSRNREQSDTHKYLTEDVFIENDWSLKELIVAVLGETFFNRRAPRDSEASRAYALPPMWDPFVPATATCDARREDRGDREIDGYVFRTETSDAGGSAAIRGDGLVLHSNELCAFNGQGDLVHRFAPRTLMNATSRALDWPAPQTFPDAGLHPTRNFQRSIGQYLSAIDPGTRKVDFQSLLYWDDIHGRCALDMDPAPDGVELLEDWVDDLIDEIDAENVASPGDPVTLADAVETLKDWILQEPSIEGHAPSDGYAASQNLAFGEVPMPDTTPTEEQAVAALFDQSLDSPVVTDDAFESSLRELCGAYLRSPQFTLAGLVRPDDFASPRLRVCNDGACSYLEMCRVYEQTLEEMGYDLDCRRGGVGEPLPIAVAPGGEDPDPPTGDLDLQTNPEDPDRELEIVPEPALGLSLLLGAAGLALLVRRRRVSRSCPSLA